MVCMVPSRGTCDVRGPQQQKGGTGHVPSHMLFLLPAKPPLLAHPCEARFFLKGAPSFLQGAFPVFLGGCSSAERQARPEDVE